MGIKYLAVPIPFTLNSFCPDLRPLRNVPPCRSLLRAVRSIGFNRAKLDNLPGSFVGVDACILSRIIRPWLLFQFFPMGIIMHLAISGLFLHHGSSAAFYY